MHTSVCMRSICNVHSTNMHTLTQVYMHVYAHVCVCVHIYLCNKTFFTNAEKKEDKAVKNFKMREPTLLTAFSAF